MERRFALGLLVLVLAATAVTAVTAASGEPRVTYRAALYAVRGDGSGDRLLVEPSPPVADFILSPGGRSILFNTSNNDGPVGLIAAERSGANPIRLSPPGMWAYLRGGGGAAFSPDGQTVAFSSFASCGGRCTRYTLYLVGRDGSGLRPIADSMNWSPSPSWSPDGHRLVYHGGVSIYGWEGSVYVLDVESNRTRAIARKGIQPVWAPRGNRIAYTATRGGYGVACFVNADGSRRRCTRGHSLTSLIWSPDARHVAFRQAHPRRIGIVDSNARHVRYLGDLGQYARPAAWSPDGRRLAYGWGSPGWFGQLSVLRLASPTRSVRVVDKPKTYLSDIRWRATGITYLAKTPVPEPQRVQAQVAAPRREQN